jgi:hypothetical protein
MKNFHLRWILHNLTDDLRQGCVTVCNELLRMLEAQDKEQFRDLLTGHESWFILEYEHGAQWGLSRHKLVPKVR